MKKILYLQSGDRRAGICSYVMQVICMAKVCKDQNIPMYVDFSQDMLYTKVGCSNDNVWEYYFEQPFKDLVLSDYDERECAVWYQDKRPLQLLLRFDSTSDFLKEARQYCHEFVKIRPEILYDGDVFLKNNTDGDYLAIHKRGCDHSNKDAFRLEHYLDKVDKHIDRYKQLLVCSDEEYSIIEFKKRYGSKVFSYPSARAQSVAEGLPGLHNLSNTNNFVYQNGRDCIVEAYLMSRSSFLLKTVSNVSAFAVMYSKTLDFVRVDDNYGCAY
jgi:hypothetical protein